MSLSPLAFESMADQGHLGRGGTSTEREGGGLRRWQPALDTLSSTEAKWMDVDLESLRYPLLDDNCGLLSTRKSEGTQNICPPTYSPLR